MPMFVCEKCGCKENTATSNWWFRFKNVENFGPEYKDGLGYCSACMPFAHLDGYVTEFKGLWHRRFKRTLWEGTTPVINREILSGKQLEDFLANRGKPIWEIVMEELNFEAFFEGAEILSRERSKEFPGFVHCMERVLQEDTWTVMKFITTESGLYVCSEDDLEEVSSLFNSLIRTLDPRSLIGRDGKNIACAGTIKGSNVWYGWSIAHNVSAPFEVGTFIDMDNMAYTPSSLEGMTEKLHRMLSVELNKLANHTIVDIYCTDEITTVGAKGTMFVKTTMTVHVNNAGTEGTFTFEADDICCLNGVWGKGQHVIKNMTDARQCALTFVQKLEA